MTADLLKKFRLICGPETFLESVDFRPPASALQGGCFPLAVNAIPDAMHLLMLIAPS